MINSEAVNSDARSIRSLLEIFEYTAKQAYGSSCSAIRPNYQSQPQLLMAGLRNITVYVRASLLSVYTNENRGGHIYTVTTSVRDL